MEKEILLWNGERKWVQVENSFLEGDRPLLFGVFTEITQRKLAEEKINYHRNLLDEMGRVAKIGGWELSKTATFEDYVLTVWTNGIVALTAETHKYWNCDTHRYQLSKVIKDEE